MECVFKCCNFRNPFSQMGQMNFLSFSWTVCYMYFQIKSFSKIFATVNTIEFFYFFMNCCNMWFQINILQLYTIQCIKYFILYHICAALTCTILLISFLQISQLNFVICRDLATFILSLSWTFWICFFNLPPSEKKLSQHLQLWYFLASWILWMCFSKVPSSENELPQNSHLRSLWSSWISRLCIFF